MRFIALLGYAVLVAACTTKDTPPAADSAAVAETPSATSLASVAGMWNVTAKIEGSDSVRATYVLNTTDSGAWTFTFPNRQPIPMRVTGVRGDTILTDTDWYDSYVRPGMKVRNDAAWRLQEGKLVGRTTAHYQTTAADSVLVLNLEGTKQ